MLRESIPGSTRVPRVVIEEPVATTEPALAKAAHLLRKYRPAVHQLMDSVRAGMLVVVPVLAQNPDAIAEKLRRYDRMDLADATLVALSEQYPKAKLITIDEKDFTIYRRRDGHHVPCIMPKQERPPST
jgi:predicted nucleic acid-binding protein